MAATSSWKGDSCETLVPSFAHRHDRGVSCCGVRKSRAFRRQRHHGGYQHHGGWAPLTEGNTVTIKTTEKENVTGDLVGTMESKVTLVVDTTTGALTIEYDATFTGSIGDKSGTSTSHGVGTGQATSQTAGSWTADETVTGGTGDFEGMTGTVHTKGEYSSAGSGTKFTGTLQYK